MTETLFYIKNSKSIVGNSVIWWRPKSEGYTCNLDEAGKYSESEARSIVRCRPQEDSMWPVEQIDSIAQRHVTSDSLWALRQTQGR